MMGARCSSEMLVAVFCEDYAKHKNALDGQNMEFLMLKADGRYTFTVLVCVK